MSDNNASDCDRHFRSSPPGSTHSLEHYRADCRLKRFPAAVIDTDREERGAGQPTAPPSCPQPPAASTRLTATVSPQCCSSMSCLARCQSWLACWRQASSSTPTGSKFCCCTRLARGRGKLSGVRPPCVLPPDFLSEPRDMGRAPRWEAMLSLPGMNFR